MESEILRRAEGLAAIAATPSLIVWKCCGQALDPEVDLLHEGLSAAKRAGGQKFGTIIEVDATAQIPPTAVRDRCADALRGVGDHSAGFAVIVTGEGVLATTRRAIVRLVLTVARVRGPLHVGPEVRPALTWMSSALQSAGHAGWTYPSVIRIYQSVQPGAYRLAG